MLWLKKNFLPILMFLVILISFGGQGYACALDDNSTEQIDCDELKLLSGVISILGEGTCQAQKSFISVLQKQLSSPNVYEDSSFFGTSFYIFIEPQYNLTKTVVHSISSVPIFISISSLLI